MNETAITLGTLFVAYALNLKFSHRPPNKRVRGRELVEGAIWYFRSSWLFSAAVTAGSAYIFIEYSTHYSILKLDEAPAWIQLLATLLVQDVALYIYHRASHTFPLLWKFHRIHHSIDDLNPLVNERWSWVDLYIMEIFLAAMACLVGVLPEIYGISRIVMGCYGYLLHSNLRLDSQLVNWVLVTPEAHRLHHSRKLHHPTGQNFASFFFFLDRAFGSAAFDPDGLDTEVGLPAGEELSGSRYRPLRYF